ncbi:sulfotransferase 1C4-like [Pollicipes pollicipes]|uniref:sulfotransferase 1C4-like n=1 Tax=Pollicipes pollicipes TaxID=41117 RepID=UPI001884ABB6|nr:sulfotransferase 1C4-like [Pollicipes pollicipes]XP_037072598.1 sulfotransferase 1C4-like [Pollicipes pollicipes]
MTSLPYPHRFEDVDDETNARVKRLVPGLQDGAMTVGEDRYFYPKLPEKPFHSMYNYPVDPRDIWVVTMPKCGTTWTQEMVWLIANDCDFKGAQCNLMPDRWNFLEMSYRVLGSDNRAKSMLWEGLKANPLKAFRLLWLGMMMAWPRSYAPPRFIKSHMPFSMLPPKLLDTCKVVYVARNPKDALVSYYHHHKLIKMLDFEGSFAEFFDLFLEDKVIQAPFMPHVREAWKKRGHPNLLFIFFEEMKVDLKGVIRRVSDFLGKKLSADQMEMLCEHLKFDNFKKNPYVNFDMFKEVGMLSEQESFVRKGKTGDWKNYFTPEMNARMDVWIQERLQGTDLSFQTELKHQD